MPTISLQNPLMIIEFESFSIETKDKIDTDMIVRKVCSHKIIRDGEILKYDKGKNAYV